MSNLDELKTLHKHFHTYIHNSVLLPSPVHTKQNNCINQPTVVSSRIVNHHKCLFLLTKQLTRMMKPLSDISRKYPSHIYHCSRYHLRDFHLFSNCSGFHKTRIFLLTPSLLFHNFLGGKCQHVLLCPSYISYEMWLVTKT